MAGEERVRDDEFEVARQVRSQGTGGETEDVGGAVLVHVDGGLVIVRLPCLSAADR